MFKCFPIGRKGGRRGGKGEAILESIPARRDVGPHGERKSDFYQKKSRGRSGAQGGAAMARRGKGKNRAPAGLRIDRSQDEQLLRENTCRTKTRGSRSGGGEQRDF